MEIHKTLGRGKIDKGSGRPRLHAFSLYLYVTGSALGILRLRRLSSSVGVAASQRIHVRNCVEKWSSMQAVLAPMFLCEAILPCPCWWANRSSQAEVAGRCQSQPAHVTLAPLADIWQQQLRCPPIVPTSLEIETGQRESRCLSPWAAHATTSFPTMTRWSWTLACAT